MKYSFNKSLIALGVLLGIIVSAVELSVNGPMQLVVLIVIGVAAGFLLSGRLPNAYVNAIVTLLFSYAVANLFYVLWTYSTPLYFLINIFAGIIIVPFISRYFSSDKFRDNTKVIVAGAALTIVIPFFSVLGLYFTRLALSNMAN